MIRGSIVAGLAAIAGVAVAPGASSERAAIGAAAVAPVNAVLEHNPGKLCADFVPAVAEALVLGREPGETCEAAAAKVLARTVVSKPGETVTLYARAQLRSLRVSGSQATAVVSGGYATSSRPGAITRVTLHVLQPLRVSLEQVGGIWLLASPARLGGVCVSVSSPCASGSEALLLSYGQPVTIPMGPPVPAAVKREGRSAVREFEQGRLAVAQSGCLACHRIGSSGNRGPGSNLTRIGSRLSEAQIASSLIDARAPMPSFKHLPKSRLRAIVRFLVALK